MQPKIASERKEVIKMALKKLNKFLYFDCDEFFAKKKFISIGQQVWKDFNSGNVLGTKVEVVIAQDKTDYGLAESENINNLYEKLIIKVSKQITIPMNVEVRPINAVATVYGDYRNQLSIIAEDIEIISK